MIYLGVTGINFEHLDKYFPDGIDRLNRYSDQSSVIELIESFHRTIGFDKLDIMRNRVPQDFTFVGRMHKVVTFNLERENSEVIKRHFENLDALNLMMPMVIYSFKTNFQKNKQNIDQLENLLTRSREHYLGHILLEFSNSPWFKYDENLQNCLLHHSASLVSTDRTLVSHAMRDKSIFYLRLLGDRAILPSKYFGKATLDKSRELDYWASYLKTLQKRHKYIYVMIDNHYSGDAIADCFLLANKLKENKAHFKGFKKSWPSIN